MMDAQAPSPTPAVKTHREGETFSATFSGSWTVSAADMAECSVAALDALSEAGRGTKPCDVVFQLAGIATVDTAGAWIIHRERARAEFAGHRVRLEGASPRLQFLLKEIENHIPQLLDRPRQPWAVIRWVNSIGATTVGVFQDFVALLSMLGVFGFRLTTLFTHFRRLRVTSILSNFDRSCRGAVPIVMLMSFLVGLIVAQQGGFYLSSFGATIFVVDMSGILILRELGVLLAAILVAGRSGSAFTAEIGAMRMREEVDALDVLGLDPVEVLVVPRLMALILAMPLLAFLSDIAAILGAMLISWSSLGISPDVFLRRLNEVVTPLEFWIGIAKAPFMALIIGLVGCSEGLKVGGSSESLGRQTTSSVVKAIFLVIVVDGLFAIFFAAVGI
ncbi:MlaE family lipid ABC transporter permease subunit [Acuticoccus sp. I52.16.1]|uniref:ABC transporter permease n=1 Tax=Acuticoccus sp. I52.16.1 TaxID=2928472 RepID=UPI001FD22820|nr:MlaE family lipid ABC transporter permease subunit [Acuticoccus sp. I52.16.1]UOM34723.1 MlaE family lipid ABC transporter permease subunit [Acuticoccus sp. I52.16.1]